MTEGVRFYRVVRKVSHHGDRIRLTEIFITEYRTDGKEKIIACYGRSAPYTPSTNAADYAA